MLFGSEVLGFNLIPHKLRSSPSSQGSRLIYLFIQLNKYLWRFCYVPGIVPVAGEHKHIITMPRTKCRRRIPLKSVRGTQQGKQLTLLGAVGGHGRPHKGGLFE